MAVEIITGHTGKEHVTAEAAGALHAGVIGTDVYKRQVWRSGWTWRSAEKQPDCNPCRDCIRNRNHGSERICQDR